MLKQMYHAIYWMEERALPGRFLIFKGLKLFANIAYPIVMKNRTQTGISENSDIIVSLTSFPARINKVWITIETLLNQTHKPQRIILWLAEEQFPDKDKVSEMFKGQCKRGLEICYCDDLRSHKKYYYTMLNNPNSIVITADDDMLYPEDFIEQLYNTHLKYPDCICCNWAHRIGLKTDSSFLKYSEWKHITDEEIAPALLTMAVGCEGVLYPPHSLSKRLYNKEDILSLCLSADDIWLKMNSVVVGTKTVRANRRSISWFSVLSTQKIALNTVNCGANKNDEVLVNMQSIFREELSLLYRIQEEQFKKADMECRDNI